VHYPSANFFNASFIWLKPSLVFLFKLFQNKGTSNPAFRGGGSELLFDNPERKGGRLAFTNRKVYERRSE